MFNTNKIKLSIEVVGPLGQDFRIKTFKLDGVYYLETSQIINKNQGNYSSKCYTTKEELFKMRALCRDYLYDNGLW
jgi:hypothetical protein